jgi:ribose-phosphate pyrophosphokinase
MNIELYKNNRKIEYNSFLFPAGEVGVKIVSTYHRHASSAPVPYQFVARIKESNDIITLMMLKDALARQLNCMPKCELYLLYLPYGRQDRVCSEGEAFSLKVFANLINSLKFDSVHIFDPHSDVSKAVFDNVIVHDQLEIIHKYQDFKKHCLDPNNQFIAPDAGANKKVAAVAKYFNHGQFVRADKLRDLSNGNILETIVYCDDFKNGCVTIIDDLCDGGRTFTELAKVLKSKGAGKVALYVTHGIFSKGADVLFDNGIDEIYTTNSYNYPSDSRCHVLDLENVYRIR